MIAPEMELILDETILDEDVACDYPRCSLEVAWKHRCSCGATVLVCHPHRVACDADMAMAVVGFAVTGNLTVYSCVVCDRALSYPLPWIPV